MSAPAAADSVSVVYALPDAQVIATVPYRRGMTAMQAVAASGLLERFAQIGAAPLVLGIFGLRVENEQCLEAGDRVEICRPLVADPRAMRRDLLAGGKVMGGRQGGEMSIRPGSDPAKRKAAT